MNNKNKDVFGEYISKINRPDIILKNGKKKVKTMINISDKCFISKNINKISQSLPLFDSSSCSAEAYAYLLKILDLEFDIGKLQELFECNQRACTCDMMIKSECEQGLIEYLYGRANAGSKITDNQQIKENLWLLTNNTIKIITIKFTNIKRKTVDKNIFINRCIRMMKKGYILKCTLNYQNDLENDWELTDYWHTQIIYGIDEDYVYVLNPNEKIAIDNFISMLCSKQILKIKTETVMNHCKNMTVEDIEHINWISMEWCVLDVKNQICEQKRCYSKNGYYDKRYITIPYVGIPRVDFFTPLVI